MRSPLLLVTVFTPAKILVKDAVDFSTYYSNVGCNEP